MPRPTDLTIVKSDLDRTMILDFEDGAYTAAGLNLDLWPLIASVALAGAPAELRRLILGILERDGIETIPVPICDHALSLLWLAGIVENCQPSVANQVADAWVNLPLEDRAAWTWTWVGHKAVHAQILAKTSERSPVFALQVPSWLPNLIDAAASAGLQSLGGVQWSHAETPLGRTCMAFSSPDADDPCLVISDCDVSYQLADDPGSISALSAIDQLLVYLGEAEILQAEMAEITGWQLSAHEWIEMSAVIEGWRDRISQLAKDSNLSPGGGVLVS